MRTKSATVIREVAPDPKYGSIKIAKLINRAMRDGKKSVAQKQIYSALQILEKETGKSALAAFDEVLAHVEPQMEVRSRRVGGASYQVPMPVRPRRAVALAVRWLLAEAAKRPSKQYHSFGEKLAAEMLDALQDQGGAVGKKEGSHRMAESNKAFAHFRW